MCKGTVGMLCGEVALCLHKVQQGLVVRHGCRDARELS